MKTTALALPLLLCGLAAAQDAHTPTAQVIGRSIVADADFAYFSDGFVPDEPPTVGTVIAGGYNLVAEATPPEGIRWDNLPPGDYELTILGRPDDYMFPNRQIRTETLTIVAPSRLQQIAAALEAALLARTHFAEATLELKTLKPTPQELAQALNSSEAAAQ